MGELSGYKYEEHVFYKVLEGRPYQGRIPQDGRGESLEMERMIDELKHGSSYGVTGVTGVISSSSE